MVASGGSVGGTRAVSEVVSVVLMVAITIVLAAMVGTVVLNMITGVETGPVAAANTQFDAANDSVSVTYTSTQNPNTVLNVTLYNERSDSRVGSRTIASVGDGATFEGLTDGAEYRLVVVAEAEGRRSVLTEQSATV
jgi:flagellin-like protein